MGYASRIAEICRKNEILLIADEIMTGMGRAGKPFAVQHWGIEPDLILVGRESRVVTRRWARYSFPRALSKRSKRGSGAFMHGFTYQAHPICTAAETPSSIISNRKKLFDRVVPAGKNLRDALSTLLSHPHVGDVRGLGLLLRRGVRQGQIHARAISKSENIAEKIRQACLEENVLNLSNAGLRGRLARRSHSSSRRPFTISPEESALIPRALQSALAKVFPS